MATASGNEVPLGMQRLSCLPCRKRKSKCDRVQPCSSCVLRSTEKFCYTSASVEDIKPSSTSGGKTNEEKRKSIASSSPAAPNAVPRAAKVRKTNDTVSEARRSSGDDKAENVDRASVLSAIASMKSVLRDLEAKLGQGDEGGVSKGANAISLVVSWDDVSDRMPSKADCEIILDAFLTEATWLFMSVHPPSFRRAWRAFVEGKPASRVFVACSIFFMAIGLYMAPSSHPAFRLPYVNDHKGFIIFGYQIMVPESNPFLTLPENVDRLQAQIALCYYMSMTGWLAQGYQEQGKLLRCARAIHLFDENKWNRAGMSDWDLELHRRLAHNIKLAERWFSMFHLRLPVTPLETRNKLPDLYDDDEYDAETGALRRPNPTKLQSYAYHLASADSAAGAFRTTTYLYNFAGWTPTERYAAAKEVDEYLRLAEEEAELGPLRYDDACNLGTLTSPDAYRIASQALIIHSSFKRLRCTVMRQFLLDTEAPVEMRVAALEHAKSIIETVPVLIAVSSSPWIAFNTSWCSSHLFCAASTFALVYLGEGDQYTVSAELDWFASKIFEVIDTLAILGAKDRIAKQCEELLIALCTSRGTLRSKYAASKSGMRQRRWSGDETMESDKDNSVRATAEQRGSSFQSPWPAWCDIMASHEKARQMIEENNALTTATLPRTQPAHAASVPGSNYTPPASTANPRRSQTSGGSKPFAASPEQISGNTPAGYSTDSRASIGEEGSSEQNGSASVWPALNDSQWTTLISSLDGDWSSMFGTVPSTNFSDTSTVALSSSFVAPTSTAEWNAGLNGFSAPQPFV